ncbi:hypothetical protein CYLTODRAFT_425115 [Cylindrobasidium torrendii FP15055 ss-10]|uniref:Uncharacterized protein n=1 Tax=Cylindrobasidium torrendii FP15055 ss-10 TaxID=1314674 RepID=A0A0D7B2X0_9AGAR|nr:hypothetical protein CYLTODRAFT_425115 [Cylindrobasidium torrendii FP15055 ss-10]
MTGKADFLDARGGGKDDVSLYDAAPTRPSTPGLVPAHLGTALSSVDTGPAQIASQIPLPDNIDDDDNTEFTPAQKRKRRQNIYLYSRTAEGSSEECHGHDDDVEGIDPEDLPPPASRLRDWKYGCDPDDA